MDVSADPFLRNASHVLFFFAAMRLITLIGWQLYVDAQVLKHHVDFEPLSESSSVTLTDLMARFRMGKPWVDIVFSSILTFDRTII